MHRKNLTDQVEVDELNAVESPERSFTKKTDELIGASQLERKNSDPEIVSEGGQKESWRISGD